MQEQRVMRLGISYEPLHFVYYVLLGWLPLRVIRVVPQHYDTFFAKPLICCLIKSAKGEKGTKC